MRHTGRARSLTTLTLLPACHCAHETVCGCQETCPTPEVSCGCQETCLTPEVSCRDTGLPVPVCDCQRCMQPAPVQSYPAGLVQQNPLHQQS